MHIEFAFYVFMKIKCFRYKTLKSSKSLAILQVMVFLELIEHIVMLLGITLITATLF